MNRTISSSKASSDTGSSGANSSLYSPLLHSSSASIGQRRHNRRHRENLEKQRLYQQTAEKEEGDYLGEIEYCYFCGGRYIKVGGEPEDSREENSDTPSQEYNFCYDCLEVILIETFKKVSVSPPPPPFFL